VGEDWLWLRRQEQQEWWRLLVQVLEIPEMVGRIDRLEILIV
jgi:hypothetical protein